MASRSRLADRYATELAEAILESPIVKLALDVMDCEKHAYSRAAELAELVLEPCTAQRGTLPVRCGYDRHSRAGHGRSGEGGMSDMGSVVCTTQREVSYPPAFASRGSPHFTQEISDQQNHASALSSFRDYFSKPYGYATFFKARAKVLAAYAEAIGRRDCGVDWRATNARWSLYLEHLPTRSRRCRALPVALPLALVFGLNAVAWDIVTRLAPPRAILAAGKANWDIRRIASRATDPWVRKDEYVRPRGRCCPVEVGRLEVGGKSVRVVRCNFLRTVYGPNSDEELRPVGRLLAE